FGWLWNRCRTGLRLAARADNRQRGNSVLFFGIAPYLSFTKSKTKIAHTPTVTGNCAARASRNGEPLGSANVRQNIATAVSTPRTDFVFQFIFVFPISTCFLSLRASCGFLLFGFIKQADANFSPGAYRLAAASAPDETVIGRVV